ncbi:type VI secretion system tip protein VgrG [Pseudomonas sp. NPDC007930]|uniref:type VI secretion system Vgr family protein n=1 Tax=Pseudomonas sp. NPDC007930 TaxID=3364417 RepID=UPI0036E05E3F
MSQAFAPYTRYSLTIQGLDAAIDVIAFEGEEHLSQPFSYQIEFDSSALDIHPDQVLAKEASLVLHAAPVKPAWAGQQVQQPAPLRSIFGFITGFKHLKRSKEQTHYQVTLQPRLALLGRGQYSRIFQHQSIPEIVKSVLVEHNQFPTYECRFELAREYAKREQVMQYAESDLAFIDRLLAEVGIWYRFAEIHSGGIGVMHFHDDQFTPPTATALPCVAEAGLANDGEDAVWALRAEHQVVEKAVRVRHYSYMDLSPLSNGGVDAGRAYDEDVGVDHTRGNATTTRGLAYHLDDCFVDVGDTIDRGRQLPSPSAYFSARLLHERYLNGQTRLSGESSCASLAPGQTLPISNGPPQAFAEGVSITHTRVRGHRQRNYQVQFSGIPFIESVAYRPPLKPKPVMAGTLPARVTERFDPGRPYADLDNDGRYRVRFVFDLHPWPKGEESKWLRLARPYAGAKHGLHLPLIPGTEVAIAFEHGDPDRPYIAHALHDKQHVDPVNRFNETRNVLRTPANNKLRMEDRRGEEHVKLSTEFGGKSQLNLGHLVDAAKHKRGEGFELRTDAWGVLRAGKGVLVSADEQVKAGGQAADISAAMGRLRQASDQLQRLSDDASAAKAEPADLHAQLSLLNDRLDTLQASVALLSAPQGMALSSGEHLQLAADGNLLQSAGNNASLSVAKRLFMGVGEGLSLFVRKLGFKLVANQGAVTVQAQNDQMELLARHNLALVSTEREVHISAKQKIILNAGGTYLTLGPAGIELGTEADVKVKAKRFEYSGAASMGLQHPEYPQLQSKEVLRLSVPRTPNAASQGWAGMPYQLYAHGTLLQEGVLDASGQLAVEHQVVTGQYVLKLANGVQYRLPVPAAYRNEAQGHLANAGLHQHPVAANPDINQPASHSDHRALYQAALDAQHPHKDDTP